MAKQKEKQNYVITTHSKSLFNVSQAPGWNSEENKVLKCAVLKFGVGSWTKMVNTGILPGKTITQLNLQTQRMMGQQSLGGFMNMRVNVDDIRKDNEDKLQQQELQANNESDDEQETKEKKLIVKAGLIINAGSNPTRESRMKLVEDNRKKYGHTEEEANDLVSDIDLYQVKRAKRLQFYQFVSDYLTMKEELGQEAVEEKTETTKTKTIEEIKAELKKAKERKKSVEDKLIQRIKKIHATTNSEDEEEEEAAEEEEEEEEEEQARPTKRRRTRE